MSIQRPIRLVATLKDMMQRTRILWFYLHCVASSSALNLCFGVNKMVWTKQWSPFCGTFYDNQIRLPVSRPFEWFMFCCIWEKNWAHWWPKTKAKPHFTLNFFSSKKGNSATSLAHCRTTVIPILTKIVPSDCQLHGLWTEHGTICMLISYQLSTWCHPRVFPKK